MVIPLKQHMIRNMINIPGWRTKRKIVVIESDDWGSIRMPSRKVFEALLAKGIRVDKLPYNCYDSLESEEDLSSLFGVLSTIKDCRGNNAKFTANIIISNPDFDKIRETDFTEYYYEPFHKTYTYYPAHDKSFDLLKEGISLNLLKPQFHGREHINVIRWMKALKENTGNARLAFDYRMYDLSTGYYATEDSFMEAFNASQPEELEFHQKAISEGTQLFEKIFGYKSESFIAPCNIWSSKLNENLKLCGVNTFQGGFYQFEPLKKSGKKFKKTFHFTGQMNHLSQCFLVRNVSFEPSEKTSFDWVGASLSGIANSFFWGKPAILSSHRMNYIGYIDPTNRGRNLKLLSMMLKAIIKKWPDIEFMDSQQLGELIND
jgi:hypothetical protein